MTGVNDRGQFSPLPREYLTPARAFVSSVSSTIVPLACLSLLAAIETPRRHAALLAFLVVGPVLFRIFGAPLG